MRALCTLNDQAICTMFTISVVSSCQNNYTLIRTYVQNQLCYQKLLINQVFDSVKLYQHRKLIFPSKHHITRFRTQETIESLIRTFDGM